MTPAKELRKVIAGLSVFGTAADRLTYCTRLTLKIRPYRQAFDLANLHLNYG